MNKPEELLGPGGSLDDKAFATIAVPARTGKPRERGQTIIADKGLGPRAIDDMLEVAGDYIDWVKLAGSSVRVFDPEVLANKIERYHAHDVRVFVAGDVLELGLRQGVIEEVWAETNDRGCQGVEIATAQISLSLEDNASLVGKAGALGLKVFAEVGRKGESEIRHHSSWLVKQINTLLAAGAYRVVVQGEGVTEDVESLDADLLFAIAAHVDLNRIVWQAKNKRAQSWLIREFGAAVNVDVEASQVVMLEARRRGIRERGMFGVTATAVRREEVDI